MARDAIGAGTAPLIEMPYYHGPIYEAVDAPAEISGHFCALSLPARIPIDNPLDADRFEKEMAGRAAILTTASPDGRAVLFSAHPEMGDLVRKYVSFGSYIEPYLPIRGAAVMEATLDFYMPNAAPSFRLIFNAVQWCAAAPGARPLAGGQRVFEMSTDAPDRLITLIARLLEALNCGSGMLGGLLDREKNRLTELAAELRSKNVAADKGMVRVLEDAITYLLSVEQNPAPAQRLLDLELPLRLIEATIHRAELAASFQNERIS